MKDEGVKDVDVAGQFAPLVGPMGDLARRTLAASEQAITGFEGFLPVFTEYREEVAKVVTRLRESDKELSLSDLESLTRSITKVYSTYGSAARAHAAAGRDLINVMQSILGPPPAPTDAKKLTEAELTAAVVRTCQTLYRQRKVCPVCGTQEPINATPPPEDDLAGRPPGERPDPILDPGARAVSPAAPAGGPGAVRADEPVDPEEPA